MFPLEAMLRSHLDDVLIVRERRLVGRSVVFGGTLLVEPSAAVERLRPRLARHGYTPFLREDAGLAWVHAIAQAEVAEPSRPLIHLGLFLATVVTTLLAGTLLLGGVFITIQGYEFATNGFGLDSGTFGSTFYILTGFHGAHVLAGATLIAVVANRARLGLISAEHHTAVEAEELGIAVLYVGHYATETFGVHALGAEIERAFGIPWSFIAAPTGL
jgi:hypothetical protein